MDRKNLLIEFCEFISDAIDNQILDEYLEKDQRFSLNQIIGLNNFLESSIDVFLEKDA